MTIKQLKQTLSAFTVTLVLTLTTASSAWSLAILHFEDYSQGTSAVVGALSSMGLSGVTTFTNQTSDFNTLLTGQNWDLVIFGEQGYSSTFNDVSGALTSYVAGNGKVLGTTWLDGGFASLMQASAADDDATTISAGTHPIFAGVDASVELADDNWGTYARSWSPTGSAIGLGTLGGGFAAILGNNGKTLLSGPLFDTYADPAQGVLYTANQIEYLLRSSSPQDPAPQPVPEPGVLGMLAIGLIALGLMYRRRTHAALPY